MEMDVAVCVCVRYESENSSHLSDANCIGSAAGCVVYGYHY